MAVPLSTVIFPVSMTVNSSHIFLCVRRHHKNSHAGTVKRAISSHDTFMPDDEDIGKKKKYNHEGKTLSLFPSLGLRLAWLQKLNRDSNKMFVEKWIINRRCCVSGRERPRDVATREWDVGYLESSEPGVFLLINSVTFSCSSYSSSSSSDHSFLTSILPRCCSIQTRSWPLCHRTEYLSSSCVSGVYRSLGRTDYVCLLMIDVREI